MADLGPVVPPSDLPSAAPTPAPIIPGFTMSGRNPAGEPIMSSGVATPKALGPIVPASDLPTGTTPNAEYTRGHPWQHDAEDLARLGTFVVADMEGGPMAAGMASTALDAGLAKLHGWQTGRPTQINQRNIQSDMTENASGAAIGDVIGPYIPAGIRAIGENLLGKPALEAGAKETADAAEQAGAQAYGKQAASNLAERADAYQQAATKTGEQRLAAGATARNAASTAQNSLDATQADASRQAADNAQKLKDSVIAQHQAEARSAAIQGSLGRTPEQTQTAIRGDVEKVEGGGVVPGPAMVDRQTQFWDAFYSPIRKMSDALGKGYDTLFNGKDALRVNSAVSLQQTVADEQNYAATAGIQYSGPAQKLLDRATEMTKGLRDVPGEKTVNREGPSQWSYPKGMGPTAPPVVKQGNASLVGSGPSIAELRGLRSDGLALASSATNARDRALGHNIADAADDTLAKSGVLNPKEQSQLDALNGKYRSYKTIFDRSLIRKVGSSAEPTDVAGEIFNDPKRFQLLTANADRDQLSTLRRTFADWVNTSGAKVLTPAQAPELAKLFPGTPLANPKSWIYQDKALTRLEDVLQSSQEVREKAMRVYAEQLGKMKLDAGQAVLKDAQTQLPMLGNFGRRVMTDMKAAKTPDEAVAIYTKAITGMSPEQLVAEATQGPTGSEAGAAAVDQLAPTQKAPEMAQREAIMNSQLPKAAKQGLPPPTTPSEAGIQAIQTGKTPAKGSYGMMARAARNWPLYASVLGAYAAMGRTPSPFIGGMAVLGATMAGSEGIRGMYYKYIAEHPEAAVQMWQAITNPGTDSNFRTLMNMMAKGAVADSAASLGKAATGTSMEPAPADKGTGPATKALEHSRAENISPVPSGTARAEKVSKEMAMGKAPEVHKDLNRGRLSLDEVNKLISSGSKRDATAMIDNVPVDQVLDAAEIGTPDEKRMLLPMIKSKLQDQFKSKNFNRTLSVALAKRYQKLAQNVDAPVPEA